MNVIWSSVSSCFVWLRNKKWNKETLESFPVFLQVFKDNTEKKKIGGVSDIDSPGK